MFTLENASWDRLPFGSGRVTITFRTTDYREAYDMWQYFSQFFGQNFDPFTMRRPQESQQAQVGQQAAIGHTPQLTDERG